MLPSPRTLLLHCRAGLEKDCAAEITARAGETGLYGFCRTEADSALVSFIPHEPCALADWIQDTDFRQLVFPRQWAAIFAELRALPESDRISPIMQELQALETQWGEVVLEYADTNDGKQLSRFCRRFERPLRSALDRHGLLNKDGQTRLHLVFHDSSGVQLGWSPTANASPWPMGIMRLRLSREAPSRSTLKLEEAVKTLLTVGQRERLLHPGMQAVDLGAAPGGWSWYLARQGLHVTAVDNGNLAESALATGLVNHVRDDGFTWRPGKPVDWLVCDMVDKPARVVDLVATWFKRGDCRYALFNLKLPMKQRFAAVEDYLQRLQRASGQSLILRCKQLYHDREEVTVYAGMAA